MATSTAAPSIVEVPQLRFTPGDGCVYTWNGGAYIDVHRIVSTQPWETVHTGERIDVPPAPRTATVLCQAVYAWRGW